MDILKSAAVWFIVICFLGILFPVIFLIWLLVLPFDRERLIMHRLINCQSAVISRLIPVWTVRIEGRQKAAGGKTYVIISNHQSVLDILLLNCLRYDFRWISKIENMRVPVLGWYLRMAGYITVDRGNDESKAEMLERSLDCLNRGTSIMLFPEGTRSLNGEPGLFKRGAFQLAISAGVPILPVVLDGTSDILPKHGLVLRSGYRVKLKVLEPVPPEEFGTDNPDILAAKFQKLITSELNIMRSGNRQ